MDIHLSRRMGVMRASDIRELLKLTARPGVISFAGGLPAPELFPVAELERITTRILARYGAQALQYSTTEGYPPLRRWIAARLGARWGVRVDPDEVLITCGSQQGLDLVGKLFLDEGDEVLCESPTYLGAISAWNAFRPRWVEVPTDDQGMDQAALEARLESCACARLIYVVPNFQNPSGRTWSLERRRGLIEAARRHGVPVVEDNPYGEVRFEGAPLPSIASFDTDGLVLSLGTFSKIFCPGLRIGWLAAPQPLYDKLVILKQGADLHTATLTQMMTAEFLESSSMDERIQRISAVYRARRDAMLAALEQEMPAGVRFTRPQGGLFLWVELPEGVDARALLARSLEHDVAFVPGSSFFPNGGHENTMRLNFSNMPEERIAEGVRRLAVVVREALAAPRRWFDGPPAVAASA